MAHMLRLSNPTLKTILIFDILLLYRRPDIQVFLYLFYTGGQDVMTLDDVRIHIDSVDRELRRLIEKRMDLAHNVADAKLATGDKIYKPDREQIVISRLTDNTRPDIIRQYTALIKKIMLVSREYQYSLTLNHLTKKPVSYTDTSEVIKTIDANGRDSLEDIFFECITSPAYISSFIKNDDTFTLSLSSELIGNNTARHMLLCINTPEYTSCIPQILNIITDFDIPVTWMNTGKKMCCIELGASINNIQVMVMLFMLTSEHEYLKVIGSY